MDLPKTLSSSIGKKTLMAVTGILLLGFVIGHMLGNFTLFAGPDALNSYAKKLQSLGPILWAMRFGLLAIVGIHIFCAIRLTIENRNARPIAYQYKATIATTYAARTMMFSGFIILAYIIFHLLHFTFKVTHPEISHLTDAAGRHDVYSMVVLSFQSPLISITYIISMLLLSFHLSHGISSLFQSLGVQCEESQPKIELASRVIAGLIFIGYSLIPAAVLFGWVQPAGGAV